MVLQRTRSGAFGCRRKISVTFRLLVIVVLATMCDRGGCAMKTGSQYGTLEKSIQVIATSSTKHDWQRRQDVNEGHLASQSTFPQTRHSFHNGSNSGSYLNVTDSLLLSDESILDPTPTNTRIESLLPSTTSGLRLTNISRSWSHPQDKVPRVMMELYDMNFRTGGSSAPYEADTVRCFPAVSVQNESSAAVESDSRGYEGRPAMEGRHTSNTFVFKISLPKGEHVRRLMLRLHVLVRNKKSPAGLERRLRVSFVKCVPEGQRQTGCRRVVVAWKDTYLHNHSWLSFNIARALKELRNHNPATLQVDVENIFTTVGNTGELSVDSSSQDVDLQPMLLLYTSKPGARRRREKRSMTDAEWEAFEEDLEAAEDDPPEIQDRNGRRASRRRRAKNSCKRKPFRVDFASIGWSDWVIAPTEYEAFQCSGKCFYPLASHLSPTKHAVIQTLMHSKSTERARRACCVPTTLGPISLLYKEDGIITFKKEYDGMVALECGCR